ncbi:MAG TPA: LytR C-terminal domain-containing protein [Micromonosporaceae bacterium]|nr:LytR C-terminal domain-containing protein [Micromonosporaceae bacterium]
MSFARVRALVVIAALTVAAIIFVVVALVRDSQTGAATAAGCPDGFVIANVTLPEPKDVKIKVFNGTGLAGQAERVADDFRNRRFQVDKKTATERKAVEGVAVLRYGPEAVGASHLLRAYFLDEAETVYQRQRKGPVVDVIIGTEFQQLGTTTEVNQSIGALGNPPLPPGACASE